MTPNNILEKAIIFATKKHSGQTRKGNKTPFILHPMRVATIVYYLKKSVNINLITTMCILHDTVEDCGVSLAEIARRFGHNVAAGVAELTTNKAECDKIGKAQYLLNKMLKMSSYTLVIKLADRLDNLRDMISLAPEKQQKTIADTTFILNGITGRKLSSTHKALIRLINAEIIINKDIRAAASRQRAKKSK